jgi:hypothetical protein
MHRDRPKPSTAMCNWHNIIIIITIIITPIAAMCHGSSWYPDIGIIITITTIITTIERRTRLDARQRDPGVPFFCLADPSEVRDLIIVYELRIVSTLVRLAFEICGVFRITLALILRMLRIGAERTTSSGKSRTGRYHGIRGLTLFDPFDDRTEQIEMVQRRSAAGAVSHSRHRKKAARILSNLLHAARVLRHALIIVERIKRRKPGIAPAVVKENLAAMTEEARQIGPLRGIDQALHPVRVNRLLDLVDIDALAVLRPDRAACGRGQDAGNADALGCDAAVPWE